MKSPALTAVSTILGIIISSLSTVGISVRCVVRTKILTVTLIPERTLTLVGNVREVMHVA
ncbi:hypothetical protein ADILRU_1051 [Leifsonia rubra CMS 76R]|nr:hypothetical protein ADILRU_1051 [Leifsonia rubra CMS 76R]